MILLRIDGIQQLYEIRIPTTYQWRNYRGGGDIGIYSPRDRIPV